MSKTKIDWCDEVWNPVWGCYNNCVYCYARKYAKRFGDQVAKKEQKYRKEFCNNEAFQHSRLREFKPQFLDSNFNRKFPRKPSRTFVNSMSDIKYWLSPWMEIVLNKIKEYPQHTFLFLTKDNEVYANYEFPKNCQLGYTVTNTNDCFVKYNQAIWRKNFSSNNPLFLSIEPIQGALGASIRFLINTTKAKWVIIGAETGNRKRKVIPKREWIEEIVTWCQDHKIPVFLKKSLQDIWGEKLIQEYPE